MKQLIAFILILISLSANAQKDVTKFMGIPVDGSKAEMKKALIKKGFKYNSVKDYFIGEFNGCKSYIYVITNRNKVWRIVVSDYNLSDEVDIKIRFNNLVEQFDRNKKYIKRTTDSYLIPESENIAWGIDLHKKRYEAAYVQAPDLSKIDTAYTHKIVMEAVFREFTPAQVKNPTAAQQQRIKEIISEEGEKITSELFFKKSVWFMINKILDSYQIILYYDNEYNHSNGEDL